MLNAPVNIEDFWVAHQEHGTSGKSVIESSRVCERLLVRNAAEFRQRIQLHCGYTLERVMR